MKFNPRPTQDEMMQFAWARKKCALWGTMGSGKSASAAHVARDRMFDSFHVKRTLIAAPNMVAAVTWPSEFAKWDALREMDVDYIGADDFDLEPGAWVLRDGEEVEVLWSELTPSEKRDLRTPENPNGVLLRKSALALPDKRGAKRGLRGRKAPFSVISYDFLPWLRSAMGVNWPFDQVILDEAVFLKNHESVRHGAVSTLVRKKMVPYIIELAGKPMPNSVEDVFGQLRLLDFHLGTGITKFREDWCEPATRGRAKGGKERVFSWRLRPDKAEAFEAKVAEVAISVKHDIGIPLVEVDQLIELPPAAREVYDNLERDLMHRFDATSVVLSANQGVLASKLLQVAQGAIYDQDKLVQKVHDQKLDKLAELMEASTGPVLCAYPFVHDWHRIQSRFGRVAVKATPQTVEQFKQGKVKLLCTHPASLAHGTDGMQAVSGVVFWFGVTYNADHYEQLNARLHRPGQNAGTVYTHRILAKDTLEMSVAHVVLPRKIGEEQALLEAVRARGSNG